MTIRPALGAYETPIAPGIHPVIDRLIHERRDRNLSQAATAERLGITQATLGRWETGVRAVAFGDVVRWAAALGLDIAAIEPTVPEGPLAELLAGGLA